MMTREEASVLLKMMFAFWANTHERTNVEMEMALNLALTALRPVSREQVEKVWRGEWIGIPNMGVYDIACSKCGYPAGIRFWSSDFCPNCGAPMTDESVDMVMEKINNMEEMTNEH